MMGLPSTLMLAAPLVLQMAAVEGSSIPLNVQRAASETELAGITQALTDLVPDGKTCCPTGQVSAAFSVTSVNIGTINKSAKQWVLVSFNNKYLPGGKFTVDLGGIGATISADVAAKIIGDGAIGLQVHVTGTGIVGVDATVEFKIENNTLKGFLKGKEICQ